MTENNLIIDYCPADQQYAAKFVCECGKRLLVKHTTSWQLSNILAHLATYHGNQLTPTTTD